MMEKKKKMKSSLLFIPIGVERKNGSFDLSSEVIQAVKKMGEEFLDNDIIAVSSKFISMSKGRLVNLNDVDVSEEADHLADKLSLDPRLAQLVLQEADMIIGGVPGFALALKNGVIAPNAGIDKSNVPDGHVMLYSEYPFKDAEDLTKVIHQSLGKRIGVVVTDSRLMPLRMGTTGLAVSVAGFEPLEDERGKQDLFGNILKVTRRALADQIASAVQLIMGEADEGFPIVLIRALDGAPWRMTNRPLSTKTLAVDYDTCIYMKGVLSINDTYSTSRK
jgi:coenzyme F420-0:L-glutamate ligase|tara:strand:- start:3794 stop:4624 length:831 start_codon:yes stop_codon:yes gene_type:complete